MVKVKIFGVDWIGQVWNRQSCNEIVMKSEYEGNTRISSGRESRNIGNGDHESRSRLLMKNDCRTKGLF